MLNLLALLKMKLDLLKEMATHLYLKADLSLSITTTHYQKKIIQRAWHVRERVDT